MLKLLIKLGLRFDNSDEELLFVQRFTLDDLGRTQSAMLLGAIVYSSFSIWDWFLSPESWQLAMLVRLAVAVLVLLPATVLLYQQKAKPWAETIYLVYGVVPGCMLSVVYLILRPSFDHGAAGIILVILFVSILLPLRATAFLVFCVSTWSCFATFEMLSPHEVDGMRFVNNFEVGMAYALSLYGVGAREFSARRQFRTAQALREEKERSEATLSELRAAQAHLVQAEKLAALGQLVAGVAHEVNTPIGLALTTSTALDADVKRLAKSVETGQVRRSELVQGIARLSEGARLLFSNLSRAADLVHNFKQVAADQANEQRRSFEVRPWLLELMSTLGPLLRRKGHAVEIACADGIVLDSHPGALAQVISNLALNAVLHGFPDGRTGTLSVEVSRLADETVRIVVSDDGIGIPPQNLRKVFDPFFTTGRDKGSTGLGLHIVYNLVASTLRGRIAIESEVDVGTVVSIGLPLLVH